MRKILILLSFLLSASMMVACHQMVEGVVKASIEEAKKHDYKDSKERGPVVERAIQVPSFDEVDLSGCVRAVYTQGNNTQVKLYGNEKDLQQYEVKVKEGELRICMKNHSTSIGKNSPRLTAYVTAPMLKSIDASGACTLDVPQQVRQGGKMDIDVSGAVNLNIADMEVESFALEVSGAGNATFTRLKASDKVDIDVSGVGDVQGDIEARSIDVEMSGAGNAKLTVHCDDLEGSVSGAGNLTFKGKCRTFSKSKSGGASVTTKELIVGAK